jgi:hypothetical protein
MDEAKEEASVAEAKKDESQEEKGETNDDDEKEPGVLWQATR